MAVYNRFKRRVSTQTVYDVSSGRVQSQPIDYRRVLPYQRVFYGSYGTFQVYYSTSASQLATLLRETDPGLPQAYDRLMHNARGKASASLGVSLIQSQDALSMIAKRCQSITAAVKSLKRGRVRLALLQLGWGDTDRWVRNLQENNQRFFRKRLHEQWLELNFGWVPLLADIADASAVLASDPPTRSVRGSSLAMKSSSEGSHNHAHRWKMDAFGTSKLALKMDVESINANKLVFSNLGLTNPLVVAWDVVPFSFVVDWFIPVSKWLKAYDPCFPVTLARGSKSVSIKTSGSESYYSWDSVGRPERSDSSFSEAREFTRSIYTPSRPSLGSRVQPLTSSLWQAVTSVALVSQQLHSLSRQQPKVDAFSFKPLFKD